jgi:maltooligosyltrehalose synthase
VAHFQRRLIAYMEKAMREAKQQTSWTQPNKEFEEALGISSKEFWSHQRSSQNWRALWTHTGGRAH